MEDTQKKIEQDNEALIQEALRDAQLSETPSDLRNNPVLHKGDAEIPAPMTVKEISSAGYAWIWDTRTFEKVPVLYYMLQSKLRKKRDDGSYRFTAFDPGEKPIRGTIKCMLHKDGENRKHYDELGFRVCNKENISNQYELTRHMQKKHPQEWAAMEQEKKERERQEDRQLQKLILEGAAKKQENDVFTCDVCGKNFASKIALVGHSRKHKKK